MFEAFYGMTQTPFTRHLPPDRLFLSTQHEECVARLQYVVSVRGLGLLTGDIGAGKSTALRALYRSLDPARHRFLYLADAALNPRAFYRELLAQLGLKPVFHRGEAKRQLDAALLEQARGQGRQPVIVIDEAQLLSHEMLEEIRFLTNSQMDSVSPVALLLAGQPELARKLDLVAFEAISQRITLRCHLTGLSPEESRRYIEHHLRVAGRTHPLFTEDAITLLHQHSRGIPRKLNNLATAALLTGYLQEKQLIDATLVRSVLAEDQSAIPA